MHERNLYYNLNRDTATEDQVTCQNLEHMSTNAANDMHATSSEHPTRTIQKIEYVCKESAESATGIRAKEFIKYLCNILMRTPKSAYSKHCGVHKCNASPEQIKIKWRRDQIASQIKLASVVNSSWRKTQPQVIWCGYLRKGLPTPWRQPQERWFEVRKEPAPQGSGAQTILVLQYQSGSSGVKRLIVSQPRREAAHDITGKAYISVAAEGRRGRVMLSLAQDHEADALVRRIGAALRPACSFLP